MNTLATLERISNIRPHNNADKLEIATVRNYDCIVRKGDFSIGEIVTFIAPDSMVPDTDWSQPFNRSQKVGAFRVRAIKLRGEYSYGIVLSMWNIPDLIPHLKGLLVPEKIGEVDISELIGVYKFEPPAPKDLQAQGALPFNIPKTDETMWRNVRDLPYGERIITSVKIDGQSSSFYCVKDGEEWKTGICSRSLELKPECDNNWTRVEKRYNILERLRGYCETHNVSLVLRGEVYGQGIQNFSHNPHFKLPLDFAAYSIYNVDRREYERPQDPHYFTKVAAKLSIPTVPILEENVILTPELIQKYERDLELLNGQPFEGVVISHASGSFKVINFHFDGQK